MLKNLILFFISIVFLFSIAGCGTTSPKDQIDLLTNKYKNEFMAATTKEDEKLIQAEYKEKAKEIIKNLPDSKEHSELKAFINKQDFSIMKRMDKINKENGVKLESKDSTLDQIQ